MTSNVEEIRQLALKSAEALKGHLNETEGWHVAKKTKDLIVEYRQSVCSGFENGYLYRGQAEIDCPKEVVFRYLDPFEDLRIKWDKDVKSIKILKQIDEDLHIINSRTNSAAKGLISPRDFVDAVLTSKTDSYISTNCISIESDEYPHDTKFVRGFNHPCGMFCLTVPGKPNSTRLVTLIQTDIKGMLPKSLVDAAFPKSMVGLFKNLRAILIKDGHLKS